MPAVAFLDYSGLKYHPNPDYSELAFNAVRQQLATEQGYLRNVYVLYSLFLQLANDPSGNNIQQQLAAATGQIEESLREGYGDNALMIERLTQASAITALFRSIPYVGPAFSAVSTALSAATLFIPSYTTVPDSYSVTLNQLLQQNARFGTDLTNSTISLFTAMVNNWANCRPSVAAIEPKKLPGICAHLQGQQRAPGGNPHDRSGREAQVLFPTTAKGLQFVWSERKDGTESGADHRPSARQPE